MQFYCIRVCLAFFFASDSSGTGVSGFPNPKVSLAAFTPAVVCAGVAGVLPSPKVSLAVVFTAAPVLKELVPLVCVVSLVAVDVVVVEGVGVVLEGDGVVLVGGGVVLWGAGVVPCVCLPIPLFGIDAAANAVPGAGTLEPEVEGLLPKIPD